MDKTLLKRSDYINSTIGWIPEQWEIQKLDEIGIFLKGKGISKSEILKEGFPCITYGEIYTEHDFIIKSFNSHIDEKSSKKSIKLNYGDILFAGSGETLEDIGKCVAFVDKFKAFAGGDIIILRQSHHIPEYLGYLLNQDFVNKQKYRFGQGHSVVHIYSSSLRNIFISLPPIAEQQKIARILRTCDMAIETTEKLITKKRERKKGLMQQLLTGKRRFNEFISVGNESNQKLTGVPAGLKRLYNNKLPFGWNNSSLYTIAKVSYGISDPLNRTLTEGIKIISLPNVNKDGQFILAEVPLIEREKVTNEQILQVGDLLFNWRNGSKEHLGKTAFFNLIGDFTHVGFLLKIKVRKEKVEPFFLYSYINFIKQKGFFLRAKIQVNNTFNKEELNELPVIYPNIKEQLKIVTILQNADKEIETIQKQLEKLKEQKRGLMQVLLTGEKRVVYEQEV